jgi:DNA mismatch repair protein MSH3
MSSSASPRKATQQPTISAFFGSQTPAPTQGTSLARTRKRGASHIDLTSDGDDVAFLASTPAPKKAKVDDGATSSIFFSRAGPSASKQTRLKEEPPPPTCIPTSSGPASQWCFTPSADSHPSHPSSERHDPAKARRHEAFRTALLGPRDPFKRRTAVADAKSVEELRQLEASVEAAAEDGPQGEDENAEPEPEKAQPKKGRARAKAKTTPVPDEDGDGSDPGFKSLIAGFAAGNSKPKGRAKVAAKAKKVEAPLGPSGQPYTPLELQVLELKKAHSGTVLMVEVGYKYLFYNEDAQVGFIPCQNVLALTCLSLRLPPKSSGLSPFRSATS